MRLVENDQDATFTGTAERQGASSTDSYSSEVPHKKTGIGAFFARLFGFDDDHERTSFNLNRDSEAYFQEAYDRKHHLVIVEDCSDLAVCREVITRFGGEVEDQGSRYYETERYRDRDLTSSSLGMDSDSSLSGSRVGMDASWGANDRSNLDRDSTLTSSRGDFSADSSLSRNRMDYDRSETLSGARLDSDIDTNLDSERVMELREEQLDVRTERMQTGEVSLRKEIITENRTIEVPVTREEIVVERRNLDGVPREGSLDAAGLDTDQKEIRIPVSEEFVHIDKKVVPREEIRVSKEKITDTKRVSEDVRREEAQVDSDGKVAIKDRRDNTRAPLSTRDQDKIQPGI
ncbi:MAG TPA: YsnF/AvaK domain-containing protein [Oligoflexus sp.]|uniref:YsnF/AvaK domain-containing protein n=1 Tax=Oligoflexus sp. TaxID=1971216 RepID=UPI002D7FB04D|nr:YsnF/AvaK domain-containing protein [Oligoflexus sp.]HET9237103.1 YsnF/AvaK domain-containing protein [Oligoflexus sp.]